MLHQTERATPKSSGHRLLCSGSGHRYLSVSHTHTHIASSILQQSSSRQQVTGLPCLSAVSCILFKFLSRACRLPALVSGASFGCSSQPAAGPQWRKPDAVHKQTDRTDDTNIRQALIKDSNSALREAKRPLNVREPCQKCSTTEPQTQVRCDIIGCQRTPKWHGANCKGVRVFLTTDLPSKAFLEAESSWL